MKKLLFVSGLFLFTLLSCSREDISELRQTGPVGSAAHFLLSADTYRSLLVEISYMPGLEPDTTVTGQLHNFLSTYLNKPDGVRVVKKQIPATSEYLLTLAEVEALEKRNRSAYTTGNEAALHILLVNARYNQQSILAMAYRSTSICVFGKSVEQHAGEAGQMNRSQLCANLMKHETGHLLGLVNNGSPMNTLHNEAASVTHCNSPSCLMNSALEFSCLQNVPMPQLCGHCEQDLCDNGGKTFIR